MGYTYPSPFNYTGIVGSAQVSLEPWACKAIALLAGPLNSLENVNS